jgi:arylsulfatase A-like enzyme
MRAAAEWLDRNTGKHERYFLLVDEFDPHEPFDTPASYRERFDDPWDGPALIWPPYAVEGLDAVRTAHLRAQYAAKVTMIDHWFGRLLDSFDRNQVWDDTVVIVTTDHGLYLGDDDYWGKPAAPIRQPLSLIPAFVHVPGTAPRDIEALTTTVDLHASVLDVFGVAGDARATGRSVLPLVAGSATSVREFVLGGYFGRPPFVTDGRLSYQPQRTGDAPTFVYSNRWSVPQFMSLAPPDERARLSTWMPGVDVPMIRQPVEPSPQQLFLTEQAWLYDLDDDPTENRNLQRDRGRVPQARALLEAALDEAGAPPEQYQRAGLRP